VRLDLRVRGAADVGAAAAAFPRFCALRVELGAAAPLLPPRPAPDEILVSFSGFLLIYTGVLLLRESAQLEGKLGVFGWLDHIPIMLLRTTVLGFGLYLLARRLFHFEYGLGTLAVALWGTLLTVLGYAAVWYGMRALYAGSPSRRRVCVMLGALLTLYSACEVSYAVWYARDYWPPYHRFLALGAHPESPDFDAKLPFHVEPDWPDRERWETLQRRPDWSRSAEVLSLQTAPRAPNMPDWLELSFSALKVLFACAFFALLWRRPHPSGKPANS
jgi:hypothetical protein